MRLSTTLLLPLFLVSLSAQAEPPTRLAQAFLPFPWTMPYGWPQAAPTLALPLSFPAMPTAPTIPDPRLSAFGALA